MISSATIKYIRSLEQKKYRNQSGSFLAEGDKIVRELLSSGFALQQVFALDSWIDANQQIISSSPVEVIPVSPGEMGRISQLKTPNQALAVVAIPQYEADPDDLQTNLTLALDNIQDPGNLGTIIRTADWFGVRNIYCTSTTADVYSPKVIQATMGSFIRVKVHYVDLPLFLGSLDGNIPVYGAFLHGEALFNIQATLPGMLVVGNESKGISPECGQLVSQRISIPAVGNQGAESLNAGVAAGILMSWLTKP